MAYRFFFLTEMSYLVFGSLKMIKKRVHLTIGIITLGIHGNECPSCGLLSGIIKEWGDAWASVAATRMPAGGSPTHSLATSRSSHRGFFAGCPNVGFLGILETGGWNRETTIRCGWLSLLDAGYVAWGWLARNDWLIIRGLCFNCTRLACCFFNSKTCRTNCMLHAGLNIGKNILVLFGKILEILIIIWAKIGFPIWGCFSILWIYKLIFQI